MKYNYFQRIRLKIRLHIFWYFGYPKQKCEVAKNSQAISGLSHYRSRAKYFLFFSFSPSPNFHPDSCQIRSSWPRKISFPHPLSGRRMENALLVWSELLAAALLATSRGDFELNVWLLEVFGFGGWCYQNYSSDQLQKHIVQSRRNESRLSFTVHFGVLCFYGEVYSSCSVIREGDVWGQSTLPQSAE